MLPLLRSNNKAILKSDKSCISNPKFRKIRLNFGSSSSPICDFGFRI